MYMKLVSTGYSTSVTIIELCKNLVVFYIWHFTDSAIIFYVFCFMYFVFNLNVCGFEFCGEIQAK